MSANTKKAIVKRLERGLKTFKIGEYLYYADYERRIVTHYANYLGSNPQIDSFDSLGFEQNKEVLA